MYFEGWKRISSKLQKKVPRPNGKHFGGRLSFCLLAFILLATNLPAQYNIWHFDINDGMATNGISFGIIQDRHGFMWFNHANALSRYDGYEFEVFTGPAFEPSAGELLLDSEGNLWIAPRYLELPHSLVKYDVATNAFIQYTFDLAQEFNLIDPNSGLNQERIGPTIIDENGAVAWFGSFYGQGIFRYDTSNDSLNHFYHHRADSVLAWRQNVVRDIRDHGSHLLLATLHGLWVFDKEAGAFSRPAIDPADTTYLYQSNMLEFMSGKSAASGDTDSFWLRTWTRGEQGMRMVQLEDGLSITKMFRFPQIRYPSQVNYANGMFWIATEEGISRFDPQDSSEIFLHDIDILPYAGDREGNLWGARYGAVQLFEPELSFLSMSGVGGPQYGGSIIFESPDGQYVINAVGGPTLIELPEDPWSRDIQTSKLLSLEEGSLYQGKRYLWSVANDGLLLGYTWDASSNQFILELEIPIPDGLSWVQRVWEDSKGVLWVTRGPDGLTKIVLDETQQRITSTAHYVRDPDDSASIRDGNVYSTVPESEEAFWVVTGSGLDLFYPDLDQFVHVADLKMPCLHNGDDGTFYVASLKTLYKGEVVNGEYRFESIRETNGFIHALVQDELGRLWMGMSNGLGVYDQDEDIYFELGPEDGVGYGLSHQSVLHRTRHGYLVIVDPEGTSIFDPTELVYERTIPRPMLTNLLVNNQPVDIGVSEGMEAFAVPTNVSVAESLTLDHRHNNFTLEFSGMQFVSPKKISYRYRLDGYDADWIETDWENRRANYMNLQGGTYTFRLQASSPFGLWPDDETRMSLTVLPPPWKTWWAYLTYVLLLTAGLIGVYRWRTRQTRMKLQRQQELNAQLTRLDQLKDQFLANTSHELRTPLNGIIGIAESLRDGIAGQLSKKAHSNLNVIISSGKRLANLVNDVLDFSKLKNQDIALQLGPVDMHSAVDVVLTLSEPIIRHKELTLINQVPRDVPLVEADENRVQQILHNLIGNAIKFTAEGSVSVTAQQTSEFLHIRVTDTGIGIEQEKFGVIFQSFEQADGGTAREYGGTGLGLSVTKQLVELHGGKIGLESEVGAGSTFHFTLPLSQVSRDELPDLDPVGQQQTTIVPLEDTATEPVLTGVTKAGDVGRILIVDDEPVNLQVLENHLELAGYQVRKAINGPDALEIIKREGAFDLIILDIMMPQMSGYEVCHKLRDMFLPGELPVVMLTAKNRVSDLVEGFSVGANDYLSKPFSKDELLSRIKTHLNLHRIHRSTGKFVPFEFLRAVGRDTITDVRLGDHTHKDVTVFFSDMRDFTSLSEQMTPEQNFQFINQYVGAMGPIVRRHQGFINQYQGDGIMAIFPKQFDHALTAAIEMQRKVQEMNLTAAHPLRVGMGMHAGPLVMGIIGDAQRNEPTTIADTVNAASRMEGLTKRYGAQIILTANCLESLEDPSLFHFRFLGKVQVKGKKVAMATYECFDGDLPQVREGKIASQQAFEEGMEKFSAGEFADATAIFNRIAKDNPGDKVAEYFKHRSATYTIKGVPDDWEAGEQMTEK